MKLGMTSILLGLGSTLFFTPNAFSQRSYTLACRPGSGMQIYQRQTTNSLHVNFKRGAQASVDGLDAGTCAWLDRGVSTNEPNTTCDDNINDVHWGFNTGSNQLYTMYSRNDQAPYLNQAFRNQVFYLQVYNDGAGCLVVTGSGL